MVIFLKLDIGVCLLCVLWMVNGILCGLRGNKWFNIFGGGRLFVVSIGGVIVIVGEKVLLDEYCCGLLYFFCVC